MAKSRCSCDTVIQWKADEQISDFDFAFGILDLAEVVAHTTAVNKASIAVMQRLGMNHDPADDFDGPWFPAGHPLRRFVLYRMDATRWRQMQTELRDCPE